MEGVVDHVTIKFKFLFSIFLKFTLIYHISSLVDVFDHSFWKLYVKTINDLDPGLNLPEENAKRSAESILMLYIHFPLSFPDTSGAS